MAVLGAKWKFPDRGDTVVKTGNNDTNKEYVDDECLFESCESRRPHFVENINGRRSLTFR